MQAARNLDIKKKIDESFSGFSLLSTQEQLALSKYLRQISFAHEVPKFVMDAEIRHLNGQLPNLRKIRRFGRERTREKKLNKMEALSIVSQTIGSDSDEDEQ